MTHRFPPFALALALGGSLAAIAPVHAQVGTPTEDEFLLPTVTVETELAPPEPIIVPLPPMLPPPQIAVTAPPAPAAPKPTTKAKPRKPAATSVQTATTTPQTDPTPITEPAPQTAPATTGGAQGGQVLQGDRARSALASSDAPGLLRGLAGTSVWGAGGVSGLPAINGMGADRVQVSVGGMTTGPACPNQMNPTMSYISPEMAGTLHAQGAAAPVSAGGDFSGGRITIEAADPVFAAPAADGGPAVKRSGMVSVFGRSSGAALGLDATATVAGARAALTWRGSFARAGNYRSGNGTEILSSSFQSQNRALEFIHKGDASKLTLSMGGQIMPYQGFPTQPMDMTLNRSLWGNARYEADLGWGKLELSGFAHGVRHGMNLMSDKLNWPSFDGSQAIMPMGTKALDTGASAKLTLPTGAGGSLALGLEAHRYRLHDWWDPVVPDASAMMSPYAFINLNHASRDRLGAFAEWRQVWGGGLSSVMGLRVDRVSMDTGPVHGYGDPNPAGDPQYGGDAAVFNAQAHARSDLAIDASAALRWQPSAGQNHELAFARRSRAPNLYERYSWSTNIMAMQMTGWFGDGNGYVGNPDLRPEVNNSVDLTLRWRDAKSDRWEIVVNPTYSRVTDYIDADRCTTTAISAAYTRCGHPDNASVMDDFVFLRFANHSAHVAGLNLSGRLRLANSDRLGQFDLRAQGAALRGWRDDGVNLYNIMPPNAKIALDHRKGAWGSTLELELVAAKHLTSSVRNELRTPGYGLVNLYGSYNRGAVRVDLGMSNLFDRDHALPLGGANFTNGAVVVGQMASPVWGEPVQGPGRSINLRLSVKF